MLEGYTPEQEAAILADLNAIEGKISPEVAQVNTTSEENTTNPDVSDDAIESDDNTYEDEDDSDTETSNDEQESENVKSEAEIRKEVERELKKKYLSQVNKKDKEAKLLKEELEALKTAGYDEDSIEAVRKIVRAEQAEVELSKIGKIEKDNFVKKFSPDKTEFRGIEEIKKDFPTMSWEAARRFYLAENKPETLVKAKSPNLGVSGDVHKDISEGPKVDEYAAFIEKVKQEANLTAGIYR